MGKELKTLPGNTQTTSAGAALYSHERVKQLFDEMALTYGLVNMFSSLGFAYYWRRACVRSVRGGADRVCDLMAGGGECLSHIKRHFGSGVQIDLVDWSANMCHRAEAHVRRTRSAGCRIVNHDALRLPVPDNEYDVVISTFGLKTLTDEDVATLADEIRRVLKKGGRFSLLEFSLPVTPVIRWLFMVYVKFWVPFLGLVFLGNPDNYRMLWKYTEAFGNTIRVQRIFRQRGLESGFRSYFFGSATQIYGEIPGKWE